MAIYEYGTFNIGFNTFPTWSNAERGKTTNLDISEAYSDIYPSISTNLDINNTIRFPVKIFYGVLIVRQGTGGTVSVTSPYSSGTNSNSITVKNVILSSYSITIVATPAYGYTFDAWRTTPGTGAGTIISTSATLTLSIENNNAQHAEYYARFV